MFGYMRSNFRSGVSIPVGAINSSARKNPLIRHEFVFAMSQPHQDTRLATNLAQQHQCGGVARTNNALLFF